MRFGVCCSPERTESVVGAGADYVEPAVNAVAVPHVSEADWRSHLARLRAGGLVPEAWNCLLPGDLKVAGPEADAARLRRYLSMVAARLGEARARAVVFGSGGSRNAPEGFPRDAARAQFAEAVTEAARAFAPHGITLCVEPLHAGETNTLNTVAEAAAFVRALQLPNVKVTADLYHMRAMREPISLDGYADVIGHAHLAGARRRPPEPADEDVSAFLAALARAGYGGRVSIEANWSRFEEEVGPAMALLRRLDAGVPSGAGRTR